MTISTASVGQVEDETFGFDNLAPTAGSWRNIFWPEASDVEMIWGKQFGKFLFDFEKIAFKFANMSPTIPSDAKIISAILRGTATADSTVATFFTVIQVLRKDGLWNLASAGPLWRSASPFGTNSEMDVLVLDTGAGTLADTAVPLHALWPIRDNSVGRYDKIGQGVEIVTAGTLGFVDLLLGRTGAVAVGNVFCEIYSQTGLGLADTLLATSDTRPASAVPVAGTPAPFRFTFSGGNQISLAVGQDIVAVLSGDYPVNANQNIGAGWNRIGGLHGFMQLFGTGVGFDDQNYPMMDSFRTAQPSPGFIIWIAPTFAVGVDEDTPSFAALLQAFIRSGSYVQGDPFGITVARSNAFFPGSTADRRWANFAHPTFSPVRMIVEWRKRNRQVI